MKYPKLISQIQTILDEKKVKDVVVLDVKDRTPFSDYYLIGTAINSRSLEAVAQSLEDFLFREEGISIKREGTPESGWIVVDAGGVVIHVLTEEKRKLFQLETIR